MGCVDVKWETNPNSYDRNEKYNNVGLVNIYKRSTKSKF